jgi:pyruvate kinase
MRKKQTKIVATLSGSITEEQLKELHLNGMDVVRINTAHQALETTEPFIKKIRENCPEVGILVDTKGPEVRTRKIEGSIMLIQGHWIIIKEGNADALCTPTELFFSYNIAPYVNVNDKILIDDGSLELIIREKQHDYLKAEVLNGGELKSYKSVNIPGVNIPLPSLSEKDKAFVKFSCEQDIEFIAHSFVRNAEDVRALQEEINLYHGKVKIIAKIENQEGVNNIEEILPHVYGIMVARGDLGVELPFEKIPAVQKKIIRSCIKWGKPVITATQMLQSMIQNPKATRAEISDVANAIYDGTDAIMLSGETAYGKYPVEAVRTMAMVAKQVESDKRSSRKNDLLIWQDERHKFFGKQAIQACLELPVKGIVVMTWTGATARLLAAFRGKIPIYAKCLHKRTTRELSLVYGVYPTLLPYKDTTEGLLDAALEDVKKRGECSDDDLLVLLGISPSKEFGIDYLEINTLKDALREVNNDIKSQQK